MKMQVLISTMNNKIDFSKLKNIKYLIINQITNKKLIPLKGKNIFNFYERGLSKSRNKAIEYSDADICLISDDDVDFVKNVETKIIKAFKDNPDADIITFQIITPENKFYKNYSSKEFWHNLRTIMKVSSIEIAFRREKILTKGLKFDENFGLGSKFPSGEEVIFLSDALKKGLKIKFLPMPIVIHPIESSGKDFDNEVLIKAKGAMFYRVFGMKAYLISFMFALKKFKFSKKYNLFSFYKLMLKGISEYKGLKNEK